MASLFALRNEMRSIVLRGVQRLRGIEIAYELAEELLLEARMVVAASLDEQFDDEWAPSAEEIRAACTAISAAWTDEERELRLRFGNDTSRLKRYVADTVKEKRDLLPNPGSRERQRRFRERHREALRAMRQDPAYKEKQREWHRRWHERNQLTRKEQDAARRDEINAGQRRRRAERRAAEAGVC
jgi:hypothetical protein